MAVAFRVKGREIPGELQVFDVQASPGGEDRPVPSVAGGQHAVEHVHSPGDSLHEVRGITDPHEIARKCRRHGGHHGVEDAVHLPVRFPYGESPDGEPGKIHFCETTGAVNALFRVDRSLNDAEEELVLSRVRLPAAARPLQRPLHRPQRGFRRGGIGNTFVETHGNVAAELLLNRDGTLWRQEVEAAVEMGAESDALVGYLPRRRQGKNLKSAAVGEDGAVPSHKAVQSPRLGDEIFSGTQGKMVGVAQENGRPHLRQFEGGHGLHRRLGSHGHEHRRLHNTVGGVQLARSRPRNGACGDHAENSLRRSGHDAALPQPNRASAFFQTCSASASKVVFLAVARVS